MSLDNRRAVPGSPRARRTFIHACEAAGQRASAKGAGRRGFIHFQHPAIGANSLGARILRWMADIVGEIPISLLRSCASTPCIETRRCGASQQFGLRHSNAA